VYISACVNVPVTQKGKLFFDWAPVKLIISGDATTTDQLAEELLVYSNEVMHCHCSELISDDGVEKFVLNQ
jgi:hypothetical protein